MARLVKPSRLLPGSTIAIVAPAGPPDLKRLRAGVSFLKQRGYHIRVSPQVRRKLGYLAGDDRIRAEALNDAFNDDSIDAIICARGGYGSLRILEDLDFDLIGSNPKVFVGYSDITVLLLSIYSRTGLVTFHGPMAAVEFGRRLRPYTIERFLGVVESSAVPGEVKRPSGYRIERICEGKAEGRIVGGNLSLMTKFVGSRFLPSFKNRIVFLEDTEEEAYRIDGYLSQLIRGTDFASARGYILGEFTRAEPRYGYTAGWSVKQVIRDYFSRLGRPCIYGFPCGHGREKITIPIGIRVALDADKKTVSFKEAGVR
jgi:muramoyltetrapeptide carboxypeptidase